jgi:hypothetical protein
VNELAYIEPWLGKRRLAEHLDCSERWIELRMEEGMPRAMIAGRVKFKASEIERWLEEHGHLERQGEAA